MIGSIQRLGFSPAASLEHRKLAVELAEVVIKWDLQRIREEGKINIFFFYFIGQKVWFDLLETF